ncbi:Gfo/Idh/MocA family protein [Nakamurella endophytica]|uniref:Gfo/Idh/MocA-like oxidoreductase N-terminal domain-containing protein n=1 Tax=Nakamurella endophytica TaxID=1748367 RepID=A0A917T971_9ACTN|nr:Gfo/Idh/MocA family oxidoreductase [Nakamurella endophytica]GGM14244.1 hypothetical protein GCM10011594_37850 [Nakamurella endophytica]
MGRGWRADFFARLARLLPDEFELVGVAVRDTDGAADVQRRWSVPAHLSPAELVARQHPDVVVSSVSWAANPAVVADLVAAGTAVLSETPPAPDHAGLLDLWDRVGRSGRVQVAEQYLLLPGHAARRAVVERGVIGTPTSVQVSSTHGYHAVSLMRGFLGAGYGPVAVAGRTFTAPLVDPLHRDGWTLDDREHPAATTLATLDWGDGRSGLYDFTDNQWHNQLRLRRILVRGSRGEIQDDSVVRLTGPRTIVRSTLVRSQLGHDLNLDGHDTEHLSFDGEVVWRNPFLGLRLMDEEIAIATLLRAAARWAAGDGPPPYPLAQACQDHLLSLALDEAVRTGRPVRTERQPWAAG